MPPGLPSNLPSWFFSSWSPHSAPPWTWWAGLSARSRAHCRPGIHRGCHGDGRSPSPTQTAQGRRSLPKHQKGNCGSEWPSGTPEVVWQRDRRGERARGRMRQKQSGGLGGKEREGQPGQGQRELRPSLLAACAPKKVTKCPGFSGM